MLSQIEAMKGETETHEEDLTVSAKDKHHEENM